MSLLELTQLRVRRDGTEILRGVDLSVEHGELIAVVGANGAGKTTMLAAIGGLVAASGEVRVDGRRLYRRSPELLARLGVAHVPAGRGTFATLSVLDNLRLGSWVRRGDASRRDLARVFEAFPQLYEQRDDRAGRLSAADQQMLALGRVLMAKPRLVILDEPSYGLPPLAATEVLRAVRGLNESGTAVVVVERDAPLVRSTASRVLTLRGGRLLAADGVAR